VYLGSYSGFRRAATELPVRTNQVARKIPEQPWFTHAIFMSLVGGLLPFGAVFTELFFIMSSLWQHQFYYLFGFVALVMLILMVTCSEISIALTYFQLTSEDYHWWWRSFFASASSAVYVFAYSILYFSSKLQIDKPVSTILYFGYMSIISVMFGLLTGAIGCTSSFYFVKAIYGSIKVD
jgi:transmembrane 9 superfamily protein 2/4